MKMNKMIAALAALSMMVMTSGCGDRTGDHEDTDAIITDESADENISAVNNGDDEQPVSEEKDDREEAECVDEEGEEGVAEEIEDDISGDEYEILPEDESETGDVTIIEGLVVNSDITSLDLSDYHLTEIPPALLQLPNLVFINLKNCSINDYTPLNELPELTALWVTVSDNDLTVIKDLNSITDLNLYIEPQEMTMIDIGPLSEMKSLNALTLDGRGCVDFGQLSLLTDLTFLSISDEGISDIGFISGMKKLTYLNLSENNISDLTPLESMTELSYLSLYGNPVSEENVKALQEKLPDCEIGY